MAIFYTLILKNFDLQEGLKFLYSLLMGKILNMPDLKFSVNGV
jgi:hypothetical protein